MEQRELYEAAVKLAKKKNQNNPEYFTGGYDVVKRLQEKLTGRKMPKHYFTGGFGIMKMWQKQQLEQQKKQNKKS